MGTWQTYAKTINQKPKFKSLQTGATFTGKIVAGNTEKAKSFVGKTVLTGVKAAGKWQNIPGKAKDPRWGFWVRCKISLSGSTLTLSVSSQRQPNLEKINNRY